MFFFKKSEKEKERIKHDLLIDAEVERLAKERLKKAKIVARELRQLSDLIDKHGVGGLFFVATGGKHK